jgi:hypothetical protein
MANLKQDVAWTIGGIAAFFGRRIIGAHYDRGIQYLTDLWIRVFGAGLILLSIIALNALFMLMHAPSAQAVLLLVSILVGIYYVFTPAIAIPLSGLGAAIRAGEPGDQVNIWLARDGVRDFANNVGIVFFWFGAYILATIVIPFGAAFKLFLFLHIIIVLLLLLLMSGKVDVDPDIYKKLWKALILVLIGGVLVVAIFQEQLGPWWEEQSAKGAARKDAQQRIQAIEQIDEAEVAWLEKHVRIVDGKRIITVQDAQTGAPKTVSAEPYIKQRHTQRNAEIAALRSEQSASSVTTDIGGFVTGNIVWILLFAGAGLGWYAFKKKSGVTMVTDPKTKKVTRTGTSGGTIALLAALAGGGYYGWNNPTISETVGGWLGLDGSSIVTNAVVLPSMSELNRADFTARFDHTNKHIDLPQRMWDKKLADITTDCSISLSGGVKCMLAFGEGNRTLDLYLAESTCAKGGVRVPYACEGKWRTGELEGYFQGAWNMQGTVFHVRLCKEDWRKPKCSAIATIGLNNQPKDNR